MHFTEYSQSQPEDEIVTKYDTTKLGSKFRNAVFHARQQQESY